MVGTPRASARSPCIICPPDPSGHGHSHGSSNISAISTVTQSSGSKTTLTKSQKSQYYYVEDYFDKSPKTDYTYVRSGSYSKEHIDDDYVIPNLSRPGLGSTASFLSIEDDMSRTGVTERSYHNLRMSYSMPSAINSRVTRSGSKRKGVTLLSGVTGRRRKKDTFRVLDYEEEEDEDEDISTISAASHSQHQRLSSQSQMSNQSTYSTSNRTHSNNVSNRSSQMSINHLYGLDHTDTELSESESNYTHTNTASAIRASHSSLSSMTSYVQSSSLYILIHSFIYTHIITTIAGLFSRCWWLGAWFYGLISKVAVLDVWILSRTTPYRRRWGIFLLLLLFLLPFLFYGLLSAYRNNVLYLPFLFGGREKTFVVQQEGGSVISGVALEEKVRHIIGDLNIHQNLRQEINQVILQQQKPPEQVAAGLSREEVELIVQGLLTERLAAYDAMSEQRQKVDISATGLKDKDRSAEMRIIQAQLLVMQQKTEFLEKEIARLNNQGASTTDLQIQIGGLREAFARLEVTQLEFASQLKNCCQNATELGLLIHEKVAAALAMLMSTDTKSGSSRGFGAGLSGGRGGHNGGGHTVGIVSFGDWLRNHFVSKEHMDAQLAAVAVKVAGDVMKRTTEYRNTHHEQTTTTENRANANVFVLNNQTTLTEGQVEMIVQQALSVFMADKTGMVDYALESAGGCVLSTRCSEDYKTGTAQYQIFGIPIYYGSNSPRSVIQPEVHPGNCWAFKGHGGYLVIQLSQTIIPTSFSLEHIPKALSPTGHIDSAPKDFSVWGLQSEHDQEGQELGNFTYNDNGPPIQFFSIEPRTNVKLTPIVELKIHSNHGNKGYTCLYRFRVHGTIPRH